MFITNVNLALKHDANSPFRIDVGQYYYATSSGKLYHRPVKVTFAPRKAGVYEAELRVSSVLADTLVIKLKGVSEAATSADLVENFTDIVRWTVALLVMRGRVIISLT